MAGESPDAMNLGLGMSPISYPEPLSGTMPSETVNLPEFMEEEPPRRTRLVHRVRTRQQQWRRRRLMSNPGNAGSSQAGEGSVSAAERVVEVSKSCQNKNAFIEEVDDTGKRSDNFYSCSICFDLAKNPVVTFCGHLFCWPCLFSWLYEFSDAEQCPVCKGEATIENLTPIYGCGSGTHEPEEDPDLRIPARPQRSSASTQHMFEEIKNLKATNEAMKERYRLMELAMEERYRALNLAMEESIRAMESKRVRREKKDKEWRKKDRAYRRMMHKHILDPTNNPIPPFPESSDDSDDSI